MRGNVVTAGLIAFTFRLWPCSSSVYRQYKVCQLHHSRSRCVACITGFPQTMRALTTDRRPTDTPNKAHCISAQSCTNNQNQFAALFVCIMFDSAIFQNGLYQCKTRLDMDDEGMWMEGQREAEKVDADAAESTTKRARHDGERESAFVTDAHAGHCLSSCDGSKSCCIYTAC